MEKFYIHPDITKAETLPAHFYRDDVVFDRIKEAIFERTWQWIGDANTLLPLSGHAYPFSLLDNYIAEPMLLVRDKKMRSNVLPMYVRIEGI